MDRDGTAAGCVFCQKCERKGSSSADYAMEGMGYGMSLGLCLFTALGKNIGTGLCLGMLLGLVIGSSIKKEGQSDDQKE